MNVLQVTPYDVYPPIDGAPHRSHGLVSTFPDEGDSVVRFCQRGPASRLYKLYRNGKQLHSERFRGTMSIADGYTEVRSQSPVDDAVSVPALLGYPQVLLGAAFAVRTPRQFTRLTRWADVVLVEKPWQFTAVASRCEDVPVVYSSHDVVTELYSGIRSRPFGERVFARVTELERAAVRSADMVVCTSDRDRQLLEDAYAPSTPLVTAPNAIERAAVRERVTQPERRASMRDDVGVPPDATVCLFVGGRHGPNVDAVERLVDVATEFADHPDLHFLLVGSAGDSVESTPQNVTNVGYVDDLEPCFDVADIGLNPIEWGGGTNIKMLDYFARGLPVVSTEFGTRGFDLDPGEHVVVVEDVSTFPDGIRLLYRDEALRTRLGRNARAFVREGYVWEAVSRSLRDRLVDLVTEATPTSPRGA